MKEKKKKKEERELEEEEKKAFPKFFHNLEKKRPRQTTREYLLSVYINIRKHTHV